jgi:small redox-active disulfide protein 2
MHGDLKGRCGVKIEVFGPGCPKCQQLEKMVRDAVTELNLQADVEKVKDVMKMAEAGVMIPPALRIDGKIKCSGRLPKSDEIKKWIEEAK